MKAVSAQHASRMNSNCGEKIKFSQSSWKVFTYPPPTAWNFAHYLTFCTYNLKFCMTQRSLAALWLNYQCGRSARAQPPCCLFCGGPGGTCREEQTQLQSLLQLSCLHPKLKLTPGLLLESRAVQCLPWPSHTFLTLEKERKKKE